MALDIRPHPVDDTTLKTRLDYLDKLEAQLSDSLQWNACESAAAYRKMRREGLNGFNAPLKNPKARTVNISGRDSQQIELRIIEPENQSTKGVWLHFHAGESEIETFSAFKHTIKAYIIDRRLCDWK